MVHPFLLASLLSRLDYEKRISENKIRRRAQHSSVIHTIETSDCLCLKSMSLLCKVFYKENINGFLTAATSIFHHWVSGVSAEKAQTTFTNM